MLPVWGCYRSGKCELYGWNLHWVKQARSFGELLEGISEPFGTTRWYNFHPFKIANVLWSLRRLRCWCCLTSLHHRKKVHSMLHWRGRPHLGVLVWLSSQKRIHTHTPKNTLLGLKFLCENRNPIVSHARLQYDMENRHLLPASLDRSSLYSPFGWKYFVLAA